MAKKYSLTPEHAVQLRPWHEKWVDIAMRTRPMTDADRDAMRATVNGLYAAANLPPPKHIVFVPSPLVGRVAAGFASAIWWMHHNRRRATWAATRDATRAATEAATRDATWAATRDATWAATWDATEAATWVATRAATEAATRDATRDATWDATEAATRDATRAATRAATEAATRDATWAATRAATWDATRAATRDATWAATRAATEAATWAATRAATWDATAGWARRLAKLIAPKAAAFLLSCVSNAMNLYAGGNMWAAGVDFLSFFRHVARLPLDWSKWQHYEAAAMHGGWRFMHPDFCIVVDFPTRISIDEQRRPHREDGPSHLWSDGFAIYSWHGLILPPDRSWIIADKARITPEAIEAEENAEFRRVMLEISIDGKTGFERYIEARGGREIAADVMWGQQRRVLEIDLRGEKQFVLDVTNGTIEPDGTRRRFFVGAVSDARSRRPGTPHEAVARSYGRNPKTYGEACRT